MITINIGNIYSQILYDKWGASSLKNILNKNLKVDIPGAKYTWLFKSKQWDGRTNLWEDCFDLQKNHCGIYIRTGLIPRFIEFLKKGKINWQLGKDERNLPQIDKLQPTRVELRDYQLDAVRAAFGNSEEVSIGWFPRGVIECACGGGKTEMAVAMYEMNPVPTFFLVHRKDLLIQAKKRFEKYGHNPGIIGDSKFNPNQNLNVATMQTLKKIFDEKDTERSNITNNLVNNCQQIFLDEAHNLAANLEKGNEFIEVADKFPAPFRWGLTATPFQRSRYDNSLLEGVTGNLLYSIPAEELIKKGYLTPPKIIMKHVPGGNLLVSFDWKENRSNKAKTKYWKEVEMKGIIFNSIRNNLILDSVGEGPYPLLVLVKTIEQANYLNKLWILRGKPELPFLSGKDPTKLRQRVFKELQQGIIKVLMATTILDEGIDLPELRTIIMASGGKSQVKTIQRLGRVLRRAPGKEIAIIHDYQDNHHSLLRKHSLARRKVYEDQGFQVISSGGK